LPYSAWAATFYHGTQVYGTEWFLRTYWYFLFAFFGALFISFAAYSPLSEPLSSGAMRLPGKTVGGD
jgi:hypothetical protein